MSVNRNRAKLNKATNSREYNLILKKDIHFYYPFCMRGSGTWYWNCSPGYVGAKAKHGNWKAIDNDKYRSYKTWKYNRKKQI